MLYLRLNVLLALSVKIILIVSTLVTSEGFFEIDKVKNSSEHLSIPIELKRGSPCWLWNASHNS